MPSAVAASRIRRAIIGSSSQGTHLRIAYLTGGNKPVGALMAARAVRPAAQSHGVDGLWRSAGVVCSPAVVAGGANVFGNAVEDP